MSILAYIGILVFIPLLTSRENKYVMYHTEQGLALFISWIVIWILFRFVDPILSNLIDIYFCGGSLIYSLVRLFLLVLLILGIINAAQGKIKELPGIGTFGKSFNFVK
jgi:uncharacterized membrane protein